MITPYLIHIDRHQINQILWFLGHIHTKNTNPLPLHVTSQPINRILNKIKINGINN